MAQVNLTSMEFSEIKESLKEFLKKQDQFKDYNFEGSGLNVILDLLAYNSQNNAYLANMLANEAEIDTAIIRANVVSRAKLLGYTPKSATAARAVLSLSINDPSKHVASLVLPRGARFTVKSDRQQFTFVTLQEHVLQGDGNGLYKNDAVEVFEGILKGYSFTVDSEERRYIIPSTKIDTSTIRMAVYDNQTANQYTVYEKASGLANIKASTPAYWVYETDGGNYEVKFGDGVFGKRPPLNGIVYVEYLETNGPDANDFSRFSLVGSFDGYENADVRISVVANSAGGADPEATSTIKLNAPRYFQSQNRAVTKEDYAAVTHDIYPYAKSVAVWGGEEATPPQFGKVFVSIIPRSLTKLTEANRRDIERKLKARSVIGITPVVIDPKFVGLNLNITAVIRRNSVNGLGNFTAQIKEVVKRHFDEGFGIFDQDFYYSNLVSDIKGHSRAIVSVRGDYTLSMAQPITGTLSYEFENPINEGSVKSSLVRQTGSTEYQSLTDKTGKLYLGETEVGTVDYKTGKLVVNTQSIRETSAEKLEVFVTPTIDDVYTGFATALVLNKDRLSVELKVE